MINLSCIAGCSVLEIIMSPQFYSLKFSVLQNGMFHNFPSLRGIRGGRIERGGGVPLIQKIKFKGP